MGALKAEDTAANVTESKGMEPIIARIGGTVVVPFSRSGNGPEHPLTYAVLGGEVWLVREDNTPIGEQDLLSIYALLAHIAHSQDTDQALLEAMVEAEFSVTDIRKIPQHRLHNVMEFLIDLRLDGVRSRR